MKNTCRATLALLALILATGCSSTSSEPAPAPGDDLRQVLAALRARFEHVDTVTVESLVGVGEGGKTFMRTTWTRPGLFREERWNGETPEGEPASLQISDGTTSWLYFPAQNIFYEQAIEPRDLDAKPLLLGFRRDGSLGVSQIESGREEELVFGAGCLCMPIAGGGKLALEADAEIAGRACHVVSYRVGNMVQRFYVAKDDASPLRFTLESSSEFQGKTYTTTAESLLKRVDTATRPDESQFRFTPPAGAVPAPRAGEDKLLAAGNKAPEFNLVDASGNPVHLSDFKGKVVLLNFWFLG